MQLDVKITVYVWDHMHSHAYVRIYTNKQQIVPENNPTVGTPFT